MDFKIERNYIENEYSRIVESFGKAFAHSDYDNLPGFLSEAVKIYLHGLKCISGREDVVNYLTDWVSRNGSRTTMLMKWCPYLFRPALYLEYERGCMVLFFYIRDGRIEKIMLTPRAFTKIGFNVDEYIPTVEFIEANAPKETKSHENHFFCYVCGRSSESLRWQEGVLFRNYNFDISYGFIVNASICPDCQRVVEVHPDKSMNMVLSTTRKQREVIASKMTDKEKDQYVDGVSGDRKPSIIKGLKAKSNAYGEEGNLFMYSILPDMIECGKAIDIFSFLQSIKLNVDDTIDWHLATCSTGEIGDTSYFFFNGDVEDREILRHITGYPTKETAWEVYMLLKSWHVMPVFWHGLYHTRKFIFDESDLNDISALLYYDLTQLSAGNLLLPSVTAINNRKIEVCCTFWKEWGGLMRERMVFDFDEQCNISVVETDIFPLVKYTSSICL